MHGIRATNRLTKKREFITTAMNFKEAQEWTPTKYNRKTHKYFRVAKIK